MAAVGEQRITYDARGLAEPQAEAPRTATIEDGKATFDAHDLSTRQINLELRRLLYEEGIMDVTVRNPGAKHSLGVGILTRCKITFDGSLGYFGCGLIDGPEIQINGRELNDFLTSERDRKMIFGPLEAANTAGKVDVYARCTGGGPSGQAGAIVMGLGRALSKLDPNAETALRNGGFLTRDSRMKERKKYGQRGARRRFQFSKR